MHYAYDFFRVNLKDCRTDTVGRLIDRYLAAVWRVGGHVDVVQAADSRRDMLVELYYYLVGKMREGRNIADSGSEQYFSVIVYFGCLDYCKVDFVEKAVAHILRKLRQMKVEVMDFVVVERVARVFARLVRSADIDRFCTAQLAVDVVVGRCAGKHVYFEFLSGLMLFPCLGRYCRCHHFRCTCRREA